MRLLFMGTPDFAVPSLDAVAAAGFHIAAVVTQPDRPRGRGMRLTAAPVKARALELGLPVLQPEKVRQPEFVATIRNLAPDCIVVVAFGQLIPSVLLELPPLGCINVHPSLLPKYRGATPIQQALLDGEAETGVTTMYLDAGMDTGDIILQERVPIASTDTAGDLHDKLACIGARLLVETLRQVQIGTAPRVPQNCVDATVTRRIGNEDGRIDWSKPADQLVNQIRAFTPWPGAFTYCNEERLKILQAVALPNTTTAADTNPPGTVISIANSGLQVSCGTNLIELQKVQPQNGKPMPAADFARGRRLQPGSRFSQ